MKKTSLNLQSLQAKKAFQEEILVNDKGKLNIRRIIKKGIKVTEQILEKYPNGKEFILEEYVTKEE